MQSGETELRYQAKSGDTDMAYCGSKEYFVITWRNLSNPLHQQTNFMIKNRKTGEETLVLVPNMIHRIGYVSLITDSLLIALPNGGTSKKHELTYEEVYTMDLSADSPEDTVMSFRVPASEVRLLGQHKLICQTRYKDEDLFRTYDLWGKRNPN